MGLALTSAADIQTIGIGVAAFLATVLTVFTFLSARKEKLGKPLVLALAASAVWAWFGFLYQVVPDLYLAREMRVVSVIGIVWINILELNFAIVYLTERVSVSGLMHKVWLSFYIFGTALTGLLLADLVFDTRFVVGLLAAPQKLVLAPQAGPLMPVLVGYYVVSVALSGATLLWSARKSIDKNDRRQALLLAASMTLGLALGGTRFTPWFGFDFYPFVGDIGFPLFAFASLYSIQRYHLFNIQVAFAQLLVFALWSFTFFRILLEPSLTVAIPDIVVFVASLFIGLFLLRAVVVGMLTQKELAQLSVEKAKSEFVSVAAHQLRTPLSAVRWALNLLVSKMPATDPNREIATKASGAADNMMYIINDLLNVSRMSEGHMDFAMKQGDLRDVAKTALSVLQEAAAAKKIAIRLDMPSGPVNAEFDYDKMVMVAENLIDNAVKYTPEGGSIVIEVAVHEGVGRIRVTDTGIGLTMEDRAHVFERFFRSERAKHMATDGSGLGLYIVKTIVAGHKGRSSLGPASGKGAVATVDIPMAQPK